MGGGIHGSKRDILRKCAPDINRFNSGAVHTHSICTWYRHSSHSNFHAGPIYRL